MTKTEKMLGKMQLEICPVFRGLMHGCSENKRGKYSVFDDTGRFWSSTVRSGYSRQNWTVDFNVGGVFEYSRKGNLNVRCVK